MVSVQPTMLSYLFDYFKVTVYWDKQVAEYVKIEYDENNIFFPFEILKDLVRVLCNTSKENHFEKEEIDSIIKIGILDSSISFPSNLKGEVVSSLCEIRQHVLLIEESTRLSKKCEAQKRELTHLREVLGRKNRELDALHFVWCSGGCDSGVHRWEGKKEDITEELLSQAEAHIRRLRTWYENYKFKQMPMHKRFAYFKTFRCKIRNLLNRWYWRLRIK